MQLPVKCSWKVWKVRVIISHYRKQCKGEIKTKPDLECNEAGLGQEILTLSKCELMTVLPSGGRSCREGEASTCNVNPEKIIIIRNTHPKLSLSGCNKPRYSEVWARSVRIQEFSKKPNVNWIMAEENNLHLVNCKLGLFPVSIWDGRLMLGFSFYCLAGGILTENTDLK